MDRFNKESKTARWMTTMKDEKKEISRRELLVGAGKVAAGAAIVFVEASVFLF